ncbi:hypothetical protein ABK884_06720 [Enterobacter hormaechei]|uniref:hypothetical protein n=1 Tax=Enterobacter hormaechei TaxID=158836 RepID=UPI0037511CAA
MSTITREFTKEQLQQIIETDHVQCGEASSLARIALASLEAEPVAYIFKHPAGRLFWSLTDESNKGQSDVMPVYTASPAPVSVPAAYEHTEDFSEYHEGWNACRAAMLQGAEPVTTAYKLRDAVEIIRNSGIEIDSGKIQAERDSLNSPVIPDCSCRTCRPVTFSDSRFVVCPECGNKRCPHANDHRNACTGSNEPGQEGSAYPAAPQQEVK